MPAFTVALFALLAGSAVAGLSPCETRTIQSANGAYVLVLLTPEEDKSDDNRREYDPTRDGKWTDDAIDERHESILKQQEIETHYLHSGLYRNDGSNVLLWPIEYVPTPNHVYVSDDGIHLIVAFFAWDDEDCHDRSHAVEFYAGGQRLATYDEDQLLVGYLPRVLLGRIVEAALPTSTSAHFNDKSKTFEISTNWGDTFRFDISTGKLLDATLSWTIQAAIMSFLLLILGAISGWWYWRRKRRLAQALQRVRSLSQVQMPD